MELAATAVAMTKAFHSHGQYGHGNSHSHGHDHGVTMPMVIYKLSIATFDLAVYIFQWRHIWPWRRHGHGLYGQRELPAICRPDTRRRAGFYGDF